MTDPVDDTVVARVLVIAGERKFADALRRHLVSWGCEVRSAADGEEGIQAARAFRPEVVIWDVGSMPRDGDAMARALRADAALAGVYAIALTEMTWTGDRYDLGARGFDLHIPKPMALTVLRLALSDEAAAAASSP